VGKTENKRKEKVRKRSKKRNENEIYLCFAQTKLYFKKNQVERGLPPHTWQLIAVDKSRQMPLI